MTHADMKAFAEESRIRAELAEDAGATVGDFRRFMDVAPGLVKKLADVVLELLEQDRLNTDWFDKCNSLNQRHINLSDEYEKLKAENEKLVEKLANKHVTVYRKSKELEIQADKLADALRLALPHHQGEHGIGVRMRNALASYERFKEGAK